MEIIYINKQYYPKNIAKLTNPPDKLFVLGNKKILNEESIAIIGSRACTETGYKIAKNFSKVLAQSKLCVVSGLAKGIDTAAHEGALEANGKTIAIIGSGFDHIFPEQNKKLVQEILKKDGAIITEYEKDVEVFSKGFAMRNRLIAGISKGVLVIEAKHRSGTSITVDFAKKQGKQVFCLAHSIDEKEGVGTNRMIQQGAYLVTSPNDILKFFGYKENKTKIEEIKVQKEYEDIFKFIKNVPISIDEISILSGLNIRDVNYKITMLEIDGVIKQVDGKRYIRNVL